MQFNRLKLRKMKIYDIRILFAYVALFQTMISKCEPTLGFISGISNAFTLVKNWLLPKELKIFLLIYTRKLNVPIKLNLPVQNASLVREIISNEKQLVLIIHGFITDSEVQWTKDLTQAYLKQRDATVGVVDWSSGSKTIAYFRAINKIPKVAAQLISFIEYLVKKFHFKPQNIHIIGHSLGAHIAGNVGRGVPFMHRVTGLDPASLFSDDPLEAQLRKTDAEYVDVIHTNTILGSSELFGSVDFYLNNCKPWPVGIQPACNATMMQNIYYKILYNDCSHHIAIYYFIESITNPDCLFVSSKTKERASRVITEDFDPKQDSVLGFDTFKYNTRGKLHIVTNKYAPYCRKAPSETPCE
ncbi:phospholipase A1-like isoform X2 [Planococcus citri]